MNGPGDLAKILANLDPEAVPGDYVFARVATEEFQTVAGLQAFATVREPEGVTLVMERSAAEGAGLQFVGTFRRITLRAHSSLHLVGLSAALSTALAERGIGANVIAGYYHDHLFVPAGRVKEAMQTLRKLSCPGP
jgi:hypothetical protein